MGKRASSYCTNWFNRLEIIGGEPQTGLEANQVEFFVKNELPELSIARNTYSQLGMLFNYLRNPEIPAFID